MFPITCNSIGDILAVAQLVRDIARALDDARGAAAEYQRLVHQMRILGSVMEEAHRIADASQEDALKTALLAAVRLCHLDIVNASKLLPGYESLSKPTIDGWRLARARTSVKKLKWRLLKASDAATLTHHLHLGQLRMNSVITCLSRRSLTNSLGQLAREIEGLSALSEHDHSFMRGELARTTSILSRRLQDIITSNDAQHAELKHSISDSSRMVMGALHESYTRSRHDTTDLYQNAATATYRLSSTSPGQDETLVERASESLIRRLDHRSSAHELRHQRFLSMLLPFAIFGAAFVARNDIDPRWRATALWATICTALVIFAHLQAALPVSLGEGMIIFIDAVGEKIPLTLHICDSLEHFQSFLDDFYTTRNRKGQTFVRKKSYEVYSAGSSQAITSHSWASHVVQGAIIEMGILLLRRSQGQLPSLDCPYCGAVAYSDSTKGSEDYNCLGCIRSFQAITREIEPVEQDTKANTPKHSSSQTSNHEQAASGVGFDDSLDSDSDADESDLDGSDRCNPDGKAEAESLREFVRLVIIRELVKDPGRRSLMEKDNHTQLQFEKAQSVTSHTSEYYQPPTSASHLEFQASSSNTVAQLDRTKPEREPVPNSFQLTLPPAHGEGPGFFAFSPSLAHGYLSHTFTATIAYIYIRTALLKTDDPTITSCLNAVLCYDTCVQSPRTLFIRDIRGLGPPNSPICPSCATPIALLDMNVEHSSSASSRGPVVPQRLAAPRFPSGRQRLISARLELPVFFLREDNGLPGLSVADALSGSLLQLQGMTEPARLGGKSSTYICINWSGLPDYRRQIQTRDQTLQKNPITLSRLVKHVGRSVQLFFQEFAGSYSQDHEAASAWRIGEGGIRVEDLLLIGLVHVSPGTFQIILQLKQPRNEIVAL